MSDEPTQPVVNNQSNLLQSAIVSDPPVSTNPTQTPSFDETPIGGKKFQFSQFPQEGQVKVPPKKPVKPRTTKGGKKPEPVNNQSDTTQTAQKKQQNLDNVPIKQNQNENSTIGNKQNFDQMPIGGKKFEIPQFPDEQPKQQKKPVKPRVSKPNKEAEEKVKPPMSFQKDQIPIKSEPKENVDVINNKSGFDEAPVGKSNFAMSEFPEGDQTPVVQVNYTMSQKLKSKAVKLRVSGLQELLALIESDPKNPECTETELSKLLKQTNPACLEKVLLCFKAWALKNMDWGDDQAKLAIESGYINGKANTKKLTVEICDILYEQKPDVLEMTIKVGLKGKVAKTLAGYISILNEILPIYGIKKMKYLKPYLADVVTILNRQKLVAVKTQGVNLLKQAYKWMTKEVTDPFIKDLKQGLKKELDTFWQGYDKETVMKAPKDVEDQVGGPKKKVDAYQLSEAVDIFKKYNEKWSQTVLKEQKWNEKVQLMKDFVNAASVPKISLQSQYRHITEMVKRLLIHSNFNVVLWNLKILGALSKGIRRPFAGVVKNVFINVIGKFREKKTQMVDETFHTLNDFSYCISIEDVIDDVKEGLNDKVPNMKVNLINWIGKFVEQKIQEKGDLPDKAKEAVRILFPIFEKLLADSTLQVRNCMAKNLGKLKILLGDNFFTAMDNKMNKTMTDKVNDAKSKTTVKKVSKQKDQKGNLNNTSNVKIDSGSKIMESTIKVKVDLSEQILQLIPKMNHSDWQKRKDSAEQAINLLTQSEGKLHSSCLSDLLMTLKVRIADPNKQLIRTFVNLTGIVFSLMSDRQVKGNAKNFLCGLADGLSDKMESNRKQICNSLNKIGDIYGKQQLLTILGSYLESDKDSRIQIINLILENEEYIQKADTREYPKGIIKCLCDRNKEIRNLGERLLERVGEKMGLDVFRNLARNQRPAIAKDLNNMFDKYDSSKQGGILNNSSLISKGVSPPRHKGQPPISGKKNTSHQQKSLEKSILNQKSFDRDFDEDKFSRGNTNMPVLGRTIQTYVEGDDHFAPLKVLSAERVQRQEKDERYPWLCDYIKQAQEDELTESINGLIKQEIAKKMVSLDYRRVLDAASQIIKICKQIAFQNQIRELYDILMKWVFLRLWGGNPAIQSIIEILPPVMSILEKKKLALNDNEVDLIIAILREYFLSAYMNEYQVSESLYTIMKCLIVLSSGERLLKKLLKQFNIQLSSIHRQIKREATIFYRDGLSRLIKTQLMEYIGNQDTLEEASQIKELKNDTEFLSMLYKRFHENVLKCFGFKSPDYQESSTQPIVQQIQPPKQPVQQQQPVYEPRESLNNSKSKKPENTRLPSNPPIKAPIQQQPAQKNVAFKPSNTELTHAEIDLSAYSIPHPASPLGKHLSKLIPPNDATVSFFNHLLNENGEKISNQLITHAKVIFGSILKSIIMMLDNRTEYPPQKIINQINLLQQALKCKNIVSNLGELLNHGTKFTLTQLVIEDENKKMIHEDLKSRGFEYLKQENPFIKAINGVMLRILQNACPQEIVNVLLRFLNLNTSSSNPSQKNIYLIIKCLTRVVSNYATEINERRTQEFLYLLNEYLNIINLGFPLEEFSPVGDRLKPQENVLKSLKTILTQIGRYYSQQIWTYHSNSIAQASFKDDYVPSFLEFMGIPYPQNIDTNKEDEHLKLINELLSKTKTFDAGIQELKKYMAVNPVFSPVQFFNSRGFDQRFIMMVMNALDGRNIKRTPTKRQLRDEKSQNSRRGGQRSSDNTNIQEKIKKLKMRFEEVQPQTQEQPPKQQQVPVASNNSSSRAIQNEDKGQERAQEIKRRIDEMKNRMNNGSRR